MSKSVSGTWSPAARSQPDADTLRVWAGELRQDEQAFIDAFAGRADDHAALMQLGPDAWPDALAPLADEDLIALVRFFTLAEARYPGWESGERSPVIPIATVLRDRGAFTAELKRWVRSNTRNRFLPHGSLQSRLT